jgi:hypothetical protein
VYDADTMSFVFMTQPGGVGGGGDASAANQVIGNASLEAIANALAVSLPLPSGAATSAIQTTQQTALDAIKTAIETLDNIVSGTKALVTEDNSAAILGAVDGLEAAFATLNATDFATAANQSTVISALAAILAELADKTEPANQQHVVVDTMPPVSANSSADVFEAEDDAGYADGETAKNLTQTPGGFLRALLAALVSDGRQSYEDGTVRPISLTTDGRVRVATSESYSSLELFRVTDDLFFGVPVMAKDGPWVDVPNNPWGF